MRNTIWPIAIFGALFFISSCKKNKGDKQVQHLLSAVYKSGSDSVRYDFVYDETNRVTKIYYMGPGQTTAASYLISYTVNGASMLYYNPFLGGVAHRDSIYYLFDQKNMLVKKIGAHSNISSPSPKNYSYDTTTYQYNSSGIMISAQYTSYDSTWSNPLSPQMTVKRTTGTITYTITNNNLVQSVESSTTNQVVRSGSSTTASTFGSELTKTFDYTSAYANRTDFTNSVVLNEVNPITELPISSLYRNLPNKVTAVTKAKDGNGNVTNTTNRQTTYQHTYNSSGLVATKTSSDFAGTYNFTYGQ